MIVLKTLKWSNVFSYGDNNEIDFSSASLVQILGKNGHGKSSIPLILEEVLYNKNSKNIKRGDIVNRYSKKKSYSISLVFEKDTDTYNVDVIRGSTQTIKLTKNGEDISAHTATNTYKLLESIIGMDHKTFSQIVYQSSAASLEFLVATDTVRKKFLIELLNLGKYAKALEYFKSVTGDVSKQLAVTEGKINTIQQWVAKYTKEPLELKDLKPVPSADSATQSNIIELKAQIQNIESTNKRITQNNKYIEMLNKAVANTKLIEKPSSIDVAALYNHRAVENKTVKDATSFIAKMNSLDRTCPTCLQTIDSIRRDLLVKEQENLVNTALNVISKLDSDINAYEKAKAAFDLQQKNQAEVEKLHGLIDNSESKTLLDSKILTEKITSLEKIVADTLKKINEAKNYNESVNAHNAKVVTVREQLAEMTNELSAYTAILKEQSDKHTRLQMLVKTFGTNGLVAYKIECLVKDLEHLTNTYLQDLSDGRFQLTFEISNDKLNVIIHDNSNPIDILALSGGERARVNVAALLAIRKLMQSLSNTRINLLVLDETIDMLDVEGKEKLVEMLLKEEHLNTIIVSHAFTHPLLEKVFVIKENNMSRIENG